LLHWYCITTQNPKPQTLNPKPVAGGKGSSCCTGIHTALAAVAKSCPTSSLLLPPCPCFFFNGKVVPLYPCSSERMLSHRHRHTYTFTHTSLRKRGEGTGRTHAQPWSMRQSFAFRQARCNCRSRRLVAPRPGCTPAVWRIIWSTTRKLSRDPTRPLFEVVVINSPTRSLFEDFMQP